MKKKVSFTLDEDVFRRYVGIYGELKQKALADGMDFKESNLWEAFVTYAITCYEQDQSTPSKVLGWRTRQSLDGKVTFVSSGGGDSDHYDVADQANVREYVSEFLKKKGLKELMR
ncbi:MAG: hypothetical protein ACE5KH_03860 [Candidatus Geothermarchaeales archaeon]